MTTSSGLVLPSWQEVALGIVTALWGGTFLVLHIAMQHCGPMLFVGVRFALGGLCVALIAGRRMLDISQREIRSGALIGIALACGYILQSAGLRDIASSRSAFITALYIPLVPVLQWIFLRKAPHLMSWVGIGLAFAGLVVLAGPAALSLSFGLGDLLTFLAATCIATEIILISLFARGVDSFRITVAQLLAGSLFSFALMIVTGEGVPSFSWIWLSCAAALGGLSALVQLVMNWAQKSVSPTRAAVIYAGEPVWGGLVGWLAGDALGKSTLLGAALIVGGVLVSELRPAWLVKGQQSLTKND
ncbi:DMT family transporter [Gluconobacter morbifer]|uniref:Permease n=1 Tax=Gluconobacter morbifer G707 TaxID=1088869 RepID=G6XJZ9_9PROT|nr:DMT family transporter [Gluconobacter morbifer]EHH67961.1 permease [Gluconobacter morbifer G707]